MKFYGLQNKVAALVIVGALSSIGAVRAAETPVRRSQASALSDNELKAFVKVYVEYQRVRSTYGAALQNARNPAQKRQIEQEANAKIQRSLQTQGLSPERYNQIFAQVNSNDALRKRVLKQVEEERRNS